MWLFFLSFLFLATPGSCDGAFFGSGSDATAGDDGVRTFYVLDFDVENLGASFIAFNGTMVAPNVQGAGVYYLWPGLEPPGSQGVYQNVLAGDTTDWTFVSTSPGPCERSVHGRMLMASASNFSRLGGAASIRIQSSAMLLNRRMAIRTPLLILRTGTGIGIPWL